MLAWLANLKRQAVNRLQAVDVNRISRKLSSNVCPCLCLAATHPTVKTSAKVPRPQCRGNRVPYVIKQQLVHGTGSITANVRVILPAFREQRCQPAHAAHVTTPTTSQVAPTGFPNKSSNKLPHTLKDGTYPRAGTPLQHRAEYQLHVLIRIALSKLVPVNANCCVIFCSTSSKQHVPETRLSQKCCAKCKHLRH